CTSVGDTTSNILGVDPKLGSLADNGGPARTNALLATSPAIDAGDPAPPGSGGAACRGTDERGVPRPQGARCDIGAFEFTGGFALSGVSPERGGNAGPLVALGYGSRFPHGPTGKPPRAGQAHLVRPPL